MIYLTVSILCSVTVGVLFKLAKRYEINLLQAVTWNYLFAILLSIFFFKPEVSNHLYLILTPLHYSLGLLLPTLFIILGLAVRYSGLARTDIAQRLSLLISLSAAYYLFKEHFDGYKIVGVLFGFLAIILVMYRKTEQKLNKQSYIYLALTFLGFGVVDILFKKLSQYQETPYTTSLFLIYTIAFITSISYLIYLTLSQKTKLKLINFICGCILGLFNFGNILYYLKAHQAMSDNPSTVFAAMNIGVILLGSILGISIFKEKFSLFNYIGLFFAVIAILLITLSKIYAV